MAFTSRRLIVDAVQFNFKAMTSRPLQSGLMILGILIGNASFISMVAIGEASRSFMRHELESLSPNRVSVMPAQPDNAAPAQTGSSLTLEDVEAILEGAPAVAKAAPQIRMDLYLSALERTLKASVVGTSQDHLPVHNLFVSTGRFFTHEEVQGAARVAVLTEKTVRKLGLPRDTLIDEIRLNTMPFKVLGVVSSRGFSDQFAPDDAVYMPVTTMARDFAAKKTFSGVGIDYIALTAKGPKDVYRGRFQVENILAWRHLQRDFEVKTNQPIIDLIDRVTGVMTIVLASTSVITILVGGIGVMNVMLVSVVQRTSEIGICKALGASTDWILAQFLLESMVLSTCGGLIGILAGTALMFGLSSVTPLNAVVPVWSIGSSLVISGSIGLAFGVLPARRAARLDPISSLRDL